MTDTLSSLTAIVLAAGSSKRMGASNKLLLPFHGATIVGRVVESIVASGLTQIVVVVGFDAARVQKALATYPVTFVQNDQFATGMTTSIHAGVRAAASNSSGFMICLADTPLIEAAEYEMLARSFRSARVENSNCIIVPSFGGQRGNPVVFSSSYRLKILADAGPNGCRAVVHANADEVNEIEMHLGNVLTDIDTQATYDELIRL